MPVSKEQWEQIEAQLGGVFGRVSLICDGYTVNAEVQRDKMTLVIAIYIDGFMRGEWLFNDKGSEIPVKFCREKKKLVCGAKLRAFYIAASKSKVWSKEERAEYAAKAKETRSTWWPYWPSPKAFCRHIRKTCTSIEVVKIGY